LESQALEALALNGGFSVLVALIECLFAGWILANGAGGALHVWLMIAWLLVAVAFCGRYFKYLQRWTLGRLDLTHALVERMVGHKTCLAQEPPDRRIAEEDQAIDDYFHQAQQADGALAPISGGLSRGWLILALAGLAPAFVTQSANASAMAISLGGILLANRALSSIAGGLAALSRAAIAWQQVATLFHAAERQNCSQTFLTSAQIQADDRAPQSPLLTANDLVYRYQTQGEAVLRGLNLTINRGERVLLQGASGGGKSTLASLLVGLRNADSGLLLLNGLDRFTLGDTWHQLASEAPQFQENHILGGTLAFNLLMGRNWPASEADLAEAQSLCEALGLGELLDRMPSGMQQMVGETGWQLSHGERSRIFLARALLQDSQLTILDESFAALDPESLEKCLQCAFDRVKTLLVIAHP
jgi:ATP-binding cassette subfamily B protein